MKQFIPKTHEDVTSLDINNTIIIDDGKQYRIFEDRYKLKDNYKLSVKEITNDEFPKIHHYYIMDFLLLCKDGIIKVLVKE